MDRNELLFGRPITEIIKERSSVRTYLQQSLTSDIKNKLQGTFPHLKGPFGVPIRFKLMESNLKDSNAKLGTYGVIKGASAYLAAAAVKTGKDLEELGYVFEKLILYAASLGLGTCWIGGTFKKSEVARVMELKGDEILPCISPVGYPSSRKSFIESVMRFSAGSKNRKGWDELFFNSDFSNNLRQSDAGKYASPLDMLRLALSASNKQPWRIVKDHSRYHFYLQHTKGYTKHRAYDLQRVDMGIAMCHFDLTAKEAGISGEWKINDPGIVNIPQDTEYVVSWVEM